MIHLELVLTSLQVSAGSEAATAAFLVFPLFLFTCFSSRAVRLCTSTLMQALGDKNQPAGRVGRTIRGGGLGITSLCSMTQGNSPDEDGDCKKMYFWIKLQRVGWCYLDKRMGAIIFDQCSTMNAMSFLQGQTISRLIMGANRFCNSPSRSWRRRPICSRVNNLSGGAEIESARFSPSCQMKHIL